MSDASSIRQLHNQLKEMETTISLHDTPTNFFDPRNRIACQDVSAVVGRWAESNLRHKRPADSRRISNLYTPAFDHEKQMSPDAQLRPA